MVVGSIVASTALGDGCGEIELFWSLKETQHQGHPLTGDQIRVMGCGSEMGFELSGR